MRIRLPSRATRLAALIALIVFAKGAPADAGGRQFSSDRWGIALTTPSNWRVTERTPYGRVLIVMVTRAPRATMMVSAQTLGEDLDAAAFALSTAEILDGLGFETTSPQLHPATGAYWLDVTTPRAHLRQAFVTADGTGYSLTLSADTAEDRSHHIRAFDSVLGSLQIERGGER